MRIGQVFSGVLVAAVSALVVWAVADRPVPTDREGLDEPDKAFEWYRLSWLDENGNLDPGAYIRAVDQRNANADYWDLLGGTDSVSWVERGPFNIMGRTRSLIINPSNPSVMFAGTVGGGIWKTTDGGTTWSVVDDRFKSIAIGCMAMDPANANVLYAGTGEGFFNGDAIGGAGIYKSVDGGATWALLPNTAGFGNVCRIAISPSNSNLILASIRYGGIQRSTDGGNTWTNPYWAQGSYYVEWHPTDPNKAIAHVIDYNATDGWFHRAMYSTNAGVTWNIAATGLTKVLAFGSRLELAYAPSNPNIVYANVATSSGKIWKSTDGGVNYSQVTTSGSIGSSWYCCPIWVDPTNANHLVAGGTYFYRSTDGGVTMTKISNGYIMTANAHPDSHLIVQHPGYNGSSNRTIFTCTDGGIYKAADINLATQTSGWVNLDQQNRSTQYYGAQGDGASGRIVGGTQDNGHHTLNTGSNNAILTFGGDGGFAAIDPTNALYGYGEYVYAQIHRSSNGGSSASYIYTGIGDAGSSSTSNFISPFVLDLNNPNTLLIGGIQLWRSTNIKAGTPTWASIRPAGSDKVSAITIAPGNSSIVWVGQNNGVIQKTSNGTAATPTWVDIDNNGSVNPLPNRYVNRIVVSPTNSNIVYVALGGFSGDNLWKSVDGGVNWADITGAGITGLPDAPIRGFCLHPTQPNWLFAGTEVGVFQSQDGGANWSTSDFGPANVSVNELAFMHNSFTLLAATHGRGLWTTDLPDPNVSPALLTMFRGFVQSGSLANATLSDDGYLVLRPGAVFTNSEFPIQAILEATSPFANPETLGFSLEAKVSAAGILQAIDLFDYANNTYVALDSRTATLADSIASVTVTSGASNYVQPGTKQVRARLRWKATTAVFIYPWVASIDQAKWTIWP